MPLFWDILLTPVVSITFVSMFVSFIISSANRLVMKREQVEAWRREIARLDSEISKARRSGDKKSLAKMKKFQTQKLQIQSKMSAQSLKVWPVSIITYLVIWWLILIPFYGGKIVAWLPWFGGGPLPLDVFLWYILCSFLFSTLFSKLFGLGGE